LEYERLIKEKKQSFTVT